MNGHQQHGDVTCQGALNIDTMLNFDSDIDGHEHAYVRCEQLNNKDTILYNVRDMSSMILELFVFACVGECY